jgi:hypothetical protein
MTPIVFRALATEASRKAGSSMRSKAKPLARSCGMATRGRFASR